MTIMAHVETAVNIFNGVSAHAVSAYQKLKTKNLSDISTQEKAIAVAGAVGLITSPLHRNFGVGLVCAGLMVMPLWNLLKDTEETIPEPELLDFAPAVEKLADDMCKYGLDGKNKETFGNRLAGLLEIFQGLKAGKKVTDAHTAAHAKLQVLQQVMGNDVLTVETFPYRLRLLFGKVVKEGLDRDLSQFEKQVTNQASFLKRNKDALKGFVTSHNALNAFIKNRKPGTPFVSENLDRKNICFYACVYAKSNQRVVLQKNYAALEKRYVELLKENKGLAFSNELKDAMKSIRATLKVGKAAFEDGEERKGSRFKSQLTDSLSLRVNKVKQRGDSRSEVGPVEHEPKSPVAGKPKRSALKKSKTESELTLSKDANESPKAENGSKKGKVSFASPRAKADSSDSSEDESPKTAKSKAAKPKDVVYQADAVDYSKKQKKTPDEPAKAKKLGDSIKAKVDVFEPKPKAADKKPEPKAKKDIFAGVPDHGNRLANKKAQMQAKKAAAWKKSMADLNKGADSSAADASSDADGLKDSVKRKKAALENSKERSKTLPTLSASLVDSQPKPKQKVESLSFTVLHFGHPVIVDAPSEGPDFSSDELQVIEVDESDVEGVTLEPANVSASAVQKEASPKRESKRNPNSSDE